ncbi:transcriptional activator FtrA [Streptomyces cyanogenus]|uniref:Transcriptional activator FtrA n=1 Tax=Streptomyces cyanogenus TaxID=80860 RepID=A0ABX7TMY6_STRCY|nr:transcriptional activator FtrA [Streptomyces cyanogenus]
MVDAADLGADVVPGALAAVVDDVHDPLARGPRPGGQAGRGVEGGLAARNRLETTDDTLDRVASACGFGTTGTLIRAFRRKLDTTPTEYRARFRHSG